MVKSNRIVFLFLLGLLLPALSSCTVVRKKPQTVYKPTPPVLTVPRSTIYHTVAPGESLWRISKIYDVPIASITQANNIGSQDSLQLGQMLRVPNARKAHQPITLYPSNKWKYIIIHHTATEAGSSLDFHKDHLARGWDKGVGYHFVINNGGGEKPDGFVEVTPRWLKQQDGAHCKADDMNIKGIGISLVGNFSEGRPSSNQIESLKELVNSLRKYYKIPLRNIMGHGNVHGSNTECPGKLFSIDEFKLRL